MMVDYLREAGVLVAHLQRALLDGSKDLAQVPIMLKRIITDDMWRERTDPRSGRKYGPFRSFPEFVSTPADEGGLGSTVGQLRGLCVDDVEARDALDQACQREPGRPSETLDNIQGFPSGTSEDAALRRLRKDRTDLHAQVLAGELTAHAAMVQAGFRPKTVTVRIADPASVAKTLRKAMTDEDVAELVRLLT